MIENPLKAIEDKEGELGELTARQDTDAELYFLSPYTMTNPDGRETPDVINVTHNKPSTDAKMIISWITKASMQIVVTGKNLPDKKTTEIEEGLQAIYDMADDDLVNRRIPNLRFFASEQTAIRGGDVARCYMRTDGDRFIPDILPCDFRYFTWESGRDGLVWGAYTTERPAALVKAEYEKDLGDRDIGTEPIKVCDFWEANRNVVYLDDKVIRDEKTPLAYPPFVFVPSMSTSTLVDSGYFSHFAESIYQAYRGLADEKNRQLSILQSQLVAQYFGGLQKEVADPSQKPSMPPKHLHGVTPYQQGTQPYLSMPTADLKQAGRMAIALVDAALQQALLSSIEGGNLTFPLSSVAITNLTEGRNAVLIPLLQTISLFYRALSRMIIRQIIDFKITAKAGLEGSMLDISPALFEGEYNISYKFLPKSPEQDIANISVAQSMGTMVSEQYKRENVLHLENPDEEKFRVAIEQGEMRDPVLAQYNLVHYLIDENKDMQARLAFDKLLKMMDMMGAMGEPEAEQGAPPQQLVPLMGGGGGPRRSQDVPSESEEMAREEANA